MCSANAWAATFSFVRIMSFKPGSNTGNPTTKMAAERVLPAPNTPLSGRSVRRSTSANTRDPHVAKTCSSGLQSKGYMTSMASPAINAGFIVAFASCHTAPVGEANGGPFLKPAAPPRILRCSSVRQNNLNTSTGIMWGTFWNREELLMKWMRKSVRLGCRPGPCSICWVCHQIHLRLGHCFVRLSSFPSAVCPVFLSCFRHVSSHNMQSLFDQIISDDF